MTVREDLEYRQSMGAEFLDEHSPGWRSLIVRPVRIQDAEDCVGGQISGDYWDFLNWITEKIDDPEGHWLSAEEWAKEHGFDANTFIEAGILSELWTIEVESGAGNE